MLEGDCWLIDHSRYQQSLFQLMVLINHKSGRWVQSTTTLVDGTVEYWLVDGTCQSQKWSVVTINHYYHRWYLEDLLTTFKSILLLIDQMRSTNLREYTRKQLFILLWLNYYFVLQKFYKQEQVPQFTSHAIADYSGTFVQWKQNASSTIQNFQSLTNYCFQFQ